MKNNAIRMFLAIGAACVCGSALAQSSNEVLSAKIPFAFQVGGGTFEAGRYLLHEHGYLRTPSIQNVVTGQTVFVAGINHAQTHKGLPKLVFHCYADHACFLAEIQAPNGDGSKVAMTKAEKALLHGDVPREMATISVDLRHAD
jgi:hypothetical protein